MNSLLLAAPLALLAFAFSRSSKAEPKLIPSTTSKGLPPPRDEQPTAKDPPPKVPLEKTVVPSSHDRDAVQRAVNAAASYDWQTAVVEVVAAKDARAAIAIATRMRAIGKYAEADSLEDLAVYWRALAAEKTTQATGVETTPKEIAVVEEPAPEPAPDPKRQAATDFAKLLYTRWTDSGGPQRSWASSWLDKVEAYQEAIGRPADGFFGPGDAIVLTGYGIVPPDPFHWPKSDTQAAVNSYKNHMERMAIRDEDRRDTWLRRKATAGR